MNRWYSTLLATLISPFLFTGLTAQESDPGTKIIIIEEKVDQAGNKTVTKSIREGNFTDEEIDEIIQEETAHKSAATISGKGYLGVMIENDIAGVRITEVLEDSPASKASLQNGDVITSIDDASVTSMEGLVKAVSSHNPGDQIKVSFLRNGESHTAVATLTERSQQVDVFGWDENVIKREEMQRQHEMEMQEHEGQMREHEGQMREHEMEMREHEREIAREIERERRQPPRFGVSMDEVEAGPGIRVSRVYEDSVAESAGLQEGDVITSFNKMEINSADDLIDAVRSAPSGIKVRVEYLRAGKKIKEKVVFQ